MSDLRDDPDPFAARLRALTPAAPALDRAAVLAAAAPGSVEPAPAAGPRVGPWRAAAAAGWLAAAALGVVLATSEPRVIVEERVVVRTVVRPAEAPDFPAVPDSPPPPAGEGDVKQGPAPVADETGRLLAWAGSPAGGALTAAGLRDLPPGWPPPAPRRAPAAGAANAPPPAAPRSSEPATVRELFRRWRDGRL